MSLLSKFFHKRPPVGLLEFVEKVYVFDSCFSTEVLSDEMYCMYLHEIINELHEEFPDSSILAFNFREGEKRSHFAEFMCEYDVTVIDYPRQYEGCPILPMSLIQHFLRLCDNWLSRDDQQNIVLLHCERGGWPLLAFLLSSFLIFRRLHSGEKKTLQMVHREAPRGLLKLMSPLNPLPSQLRYLQYVARRNISPEWPPPEPTLSLDCVILRSIPCFDSQNGCRPFIRIFGRNLQSDDGISTKMLFSMLKNKKSLRHYRQADNDLIKIDIQCLVQGDVVLECVHLESGLEREAMMFRIMFNTAFIRSNILMLNSDNLDILWDSKVRYPKGFRAEILFGDGLNISPQRIPTTILNVDQNGGLPIEAFSRVQELFNDVEWIDDNDDAALWLIKQLSVYRNVKDLSRLQSKVSSYGSTADSEDEFNSSSIEDFSEFEFERVDSVDDSRVLNFIEDLEQRPTFIKLAEDINDTAVHKPKMPSLWDLFKSEDSPIQNGDIGHENSTEEKVSLSSVVQPSLPMLPPVSPPHQPFSSRSLVFSTQDSDDTDLKPTMVYPPPLPPSMFSNRGTSPPHTTSNCQPPPQPTLPPPPYSSFSPSVKPPPLPPPPVRQTSGSENMPPSLSPLLAPGPATAPLPPPAPKLPNAPPPPPPPPALKPPNAPPPPPPPAPKPPNAPPPPPRKSPVPPPPPGSKGPKVAPPPPPLVGKGKVSLGPGAEKNQAIESNTVAPKKSSLKPLHWNKVTRAMQGSLWDDSQKQESLSRAPEIDISELENLFSAASISNGAGENRVGGRGSIIHKPAKKQLIDLRRAYNCEIMLTNIKIPFPDLINAILTLDSSELDIDQVENLIKFCPTKEEMALLKRHTEEKEMLGKCEQFFLELMKVPRVESKLRVFGFKMQFSSQVDDMKSDLNTIKAAAVEVRESAKLRQIMQTILTLGNALNQGTARGSAVGFKLDSLLKLSDTRARNNKMTLMHYLCKVLAEKLPDVLDFDKELTHLEGASKIQLKSLAEEMQSVTKGLVKVEEELLASQDDGDVSEGFEKILKEFLHTAEAEVKSLTSLYAEVGRSADSLSQYFGEDPARCPFEQVVQILNVFVKTFNKSREENERQAEAEKKRLEKEALKEANSSAKKETVGDSVKAFFHSHKLTM